MRWRPARNTPPRSDSPTPTRGRTSARSSYPPPPPPPPREPHGARGDPGAAGDETDLGVGDLTRRGAAQLLHSFAHVVQSVDVCLGEAAAVRVHRQHAALHEGAARAALGEAVVLELQDDHSRIVIVDLRDVDVARADAGFGVQVFGDRTAPAGRVVFVGKVMRGPRAETRRSAGALRP